MMASVCANFLVVISLMSFAASIRSAKIVGLPMMGGSQYMGMKNIGLELAKRGHQFTILVSSAQKIKPAKEIHHSVYKVPYGSDVIENLAAKSINEGMIGTLMSSNVTMPGLQEDFCEKLITSKELLEPLKSFDLLITDTSMPCGHVLSDYLDIKKVEYCPVSPRSMLPLLDPYDSLSIGSYVPMLMTWNPGRMNFLQRVKNIISALVMIAMDPFLFHRPLEKLKVKHNIKPDKSFSESMNENQLILFLSDFALEYVYPVPPHFKLIGAVNIQPVKPFPPDLQQLIDSSGDDGAIIVSFGSNIAAMSKEKVDIMAEAFGRLKQKVIWRLTGYIPSSLSSNIKPVSWLPQNDLLSNEKLRLFVTHVGQNSLYEAAYHGVPVVSIPLFGDQHDNSKLVEFRGFGLSVDFFKLTADELHSTIERVIKNPSFRENAQRISRLMQDRPRSPVQEAGDWIEYALRHESLAHLRPYSGQLPWYQYFLVDVAVFLVLVVLVVIMVIKYTVRLMCWVCCRRDKKEKTQ